MRYHENHDVYVRDKEYASKGSAYTGVALGAAALGTALLGGNLDIFGNRNNDRHARAVCSEEIPVNRYEAAQQARIAELETEVKLRDANTYTLQHMNEMRNYVDNRFNDINKALGEQAVKNEQIAGSFALIGERITCCKNEFMSALNRERDERCCADNSIVTYSNATFYPKQVANVEVGTTTTSQAVYNPLPRCNCNCNC